MLALRDHKSGPEALNPGKQPGIGKSLVTEMAVGPKRVPEGSEDRPLAANLKMSSKNQMLQMWDNEENSLFDSRDEAMPALTRTDYDVKAVLNQKELERKRRSEELMKMEANLEFVIPTKTNG